MAEYYRAIPDHGLDFSVLSTLNECNLTQQIPTNSPLVNHSLGMQPIKFFGAV